MKLTFVLWEIKLTALMISITLLMHYFSVCFAEEAPGAPPETPPETPPEAPASHHRMRRFVFSKNSKVSFDVELDLPIPSLGGVDVEAVLEFPLTITMLNDTVLFNPITFPHIVVPQTQALPLNYPSFLPNYYSYDAYFGSGSTSPFYPYNVMKRSIGAASAQHRFDLFSSISESLERFANIFFPQQTLIIFEA